MSRFNNFTPPELEGTTRQLAQHLPQGRAWEAKSVPDTTLYKVLAGMAAPMNAVQQQQFALLLEFFVLNTDQFIEKWETSVGLPNDCFPATGTLAQRRAAVLRRLNKRPIVTLAEMQAYVDEIFPNQGIVLYNGTEYYGFEYEFEGTFLGALSDRFIIVAEIPVQQPEFEYEFEFEFTGAVDTTRLRCVLEEVIPATTILLIEEVSRAT